MFGDASSNVVPLLHWRSAADNMHKLLVLNARLITRYYVTKVG